MTQCRDYSYITIIEEIRLITLPEEWKQLIAKDHHLIFVREGRVKINSSLYNGMLCRGDMVVLPSESNSISITPITQPYSAYYIRFASAKTSRISGNWNIDDTPPPFSGMLRIQLTPIIRHRFDLLHRIWEESSNRLTDSLTIAWLELWEAIKAELVIEELAFETRLQNIIKHMDQHFEEKFHVEDIARHSGVTPIIFFKRFKETTSLSPLQYITRNRIEKARELLVEGDVPMREIANEIGYPDMYYFSRIFKKVIGIPPIRYRQLLQRKIAVLSLPLYENLLALGVPENKLIPLWNKENQKQVYKKYEPSCMEFQLLRKEKPELIIGTDNNRSIYNQLVEIAPTYLIRYKSFTWRKHLYELAEILEIKEIAQYWLNYYEHKTATVRARIHQQLGDQTVLAALINDKRIRVFGANRRKIGHLLYSDLKLNAPIGTDQFIFSDVESLTELNKFKADHLLLLGDYSIHKEKSVQLSGQVHYANVNPWLQYSAIGHERSIEEALFHFSTNEAQTGLYM